MMTHRRYLISVGFLFFGVLLFMGALNLWIDPLWISETTHDYNRYQRFFNERQQKTNRLHYGNHTYNAVLIGSSRGTYIDHTLFSDVKIFNYSASALYPDEYEGYLQFFSDTCGEPETIFLALDFFGTRFPKKRRRFLAPDFYIHKTTAPDYRLRHLLSIDTCKYALKSLSQNLNPPRMQTHGVYDHQNLTKRHETPPEKRDRKFQSTFNTFRKNHYDATYQYTEKMIEPLRAIRARYKNSRIVVFTTPISADLFDLLVESGRYPDYGRWLKDLVDIFGNVIDTMGYTPFTTDRTHYLDGHHFAPAASASLVAAIESPDQSCNARVVTPSTLTAHLAQQYENALRHMAGRKENPGTVKG